MNVEVLFFGRLRELTEEPKVIVTLEDGARLSGLAHRLAELYGPEMEEQLETIKSLRILVNGREYAQLGGMEAELKDGDTIVLMPPIFGG